MIDSTTARGAGARFLIPFLIGDVALLATAFAIFQQANRPMTWQEVAAVGACVAMGAWLGVWPFVLRHRAELKLAENASLGDTLAQIQQLEQVGERIARATSQWQTVQEHASRTVESARQIGDRISTETKDFLASAQRANDTERQHLQLEADKLRRAEAEWLQVVVRMLDHIFALYSAAARSGQQHVIQQLGMFQAACRDTARRVGLAPFVPGPDAPYDPAIHHLTDPKAPVPDEPLVAVVVATGYTYQGQMLRPALVVLRSGLVPLPDSGDGAEAAAVMPPPLPAFVVNQVPPGAAVTGSTRPDDRGESGPPGASTENPEPPPNGPQGNLPI